MMMCEVPSSLSTNQGVKSGWSQWIFFFCFILAICTTLSVKIFYLPIYLKEILHITLQSALNKTTLPYSNLKRNWTKKNVKETLTSRVVVLFCYKCLQLPISIIVHMCSSVCICHTALCCDDVTPMCRSDIIIARPFKQLNRPNLEGRSGEDENRPKPAEALTLQRWRASFDK